MIILRYKYFNEGLVIRWPVPNPSLLLYPKIEKTNRFKKEYELIGKDARKLVDRLEESLRMDIFMKMIQIILLKKKLIV